MGYISRTPADLVINPRNVMLGRGQTRTRWWKGGDPVATAFWNSLSVVFPLGEAFFIDSVRHYRDAVSPGLRSQIDAFIKQEAMHSREHAHFNKQILEAGYDISSMVADMSEWREETKKNPPDVNLAITVATEHWTAMIAHAALKSERHFKHEPTESRRLWKWHALEEIEHKAVAFDTFLAVTRDLTRFERWKLRSLVFLLLTWDFLLERARFMGRFLAQDGLNKPKAWMHAFVYLLIYPGLLRQVFPAWLAFFRPNFHPWQQDDRALIAKTEAQLALRIVGQSDVTDI
jgi:predicted metal-dependent hydrolase